MAEEGQATAADLCKFILRVLFEAMPAGWEMLTTTHDSFLLQVPEGEASEAASWLKEKMETPVPWLEGRSWRSSVKVGGDWRAVS